MTRRTYPDGGLRHETVIHEHAHRPRQKLILARVLDPRLDERRLVLPRRTHIPQLRCELKGGDDDFVGDTVAGEGHSALDAVRE